MTATRRVTVVRPGEDPTRVRTELTCLTAAEVPPDSLAALVDFLDGHPEAGAVAPVVVVDPAGEVLAAGGIAGGDGGLLPYRAAPQGLFPREVDYAGAACVLVRTAALHALGGFRFDGATSIADLGFALRAHGWPTWVLPAARVTCPVVPATGLNPRSQAEFRARWAGALAGRAPVAGLDEHPHRVWWLRDHLAPYRVVLVDDRVPQPQRGRGDPRTLAVLDAWRAADPRARVTFYAAGDDNAAAHAPALRARGVEVVWGEPDAQRWSSARAGLYDVVVAFRPHNFAACGEPIGLGQPQAVRVYDSEALFHRRVEQRAARATDQLARAALLAEADRLRKLEIRAIRWADVVVCVSAEEAAWVRSVAPDTPVHVLCYPTTVPAVVPGRDGRRGLMFLGGFDSTPGTPNEEAVLELAGRLLPALRARHPGLDLRIVGAEPSPAVRQLAGKHVAVLGRVPDPLPLLGSALLQVVPMRCGAGVKIKFVDSMAAGLPFVTTPIGAEGLHLGKLARHLVGESPAELVELCHALLIDVPLWTEVQQGLLDVCRTHFSTDRFAAAMLEVLADCAVQPAGLPLRRSQPAAQ